MAFYFYYKVFKLFLNVDFIVDNDKRYMILKNILGLDVLPELKMFENNPTAHNKSLVESAAKQSERLHKEAEWYRSKAKK